MPAGLISISTPSRSSSPGLSGSSGSSASGLLGSGAAVLGVSPPSTRAGPVLVGHQPQPAAAAGEQLRGDLLEVSRRRLERLLERLADLPVGVGDQLLELAQRGLQVVALALELLDVLERLGVLLLGERVDRAELLAAPRQPLDAAAQRLALLVGERLRRRRRFELEPRGERAELLLALARAVPGPLERAPRRR